MTVPEGAQLSQIIRQKVEEFKRLCLGLDEDAAVSAPSGRWSPKQIVSHLCGPEGRGLLPTIQAFLEHETPRIDIEAENPFFTESRASMTLAELLAEFEGEYGRMAEVVQGLSPEQLNRKAHIPLLKESQIGEYPRLGDWVLALADYHVGFHIDHLKEILNELGHEPDKTKH